MLATATPIGGPRDQAPDGKALPFAVAVSAGLEIRPAAFPMAAVVECRSEISPAGEFRDALAPILLGAGKTVRKDDQRPGRIGLFVSDQHGDFLDEGFFDEHGCSFK